MQECWRLQLVNISYHPTYTALAVNELPHLYDPVVTGEALSEFSGFIARC